MEPLSGGLICRIYIRVRGGRVLGFCVFSGEFVCYFFITIYHYRF